MVNALRTALLNLTGVTVPQYPGDEYVPLGYGPVTLSPGLASVDKFLFGTRPDRALRNYRLQEFMSIIHGSELAEFAYALDPRVTYWPPTQQLFDMIDAGPQVSKIDTTTAELFPNFRAGDRTTIDQIYYKWLVTVIDADTVSVQQLINPIYLPAAIEHDYTITDGLSDVIPFDGSPFTFNFQQEIGGSWTVSYLAKPLQSLVDVYTSLVNGLTDESRLALFGSNPEEPYKTFKNLWELNPHMPYRLAGVVLALGYRINALRS